MPILVSASEGCYVRVQLHLVTGISIKNASYSAFHLLGITARSSFIITRRSHVLIRLRLSYCIRLSRRPSRLLVILSLFEDCRRRNDTFGVEISNIVPPY